MYDPADAASVLDFVDAAMAAGTIVAWGAVRRHTDNGVVFCVHDDSTPCAREHEDEWPTFYVAAPEGT
ncbi:MAG TPA: hypothetical protein VF288_10655 [Mycobacteriales bacterium]